MMMMMRGLHKQTVIDAQFLYIITFHMPMSLRPAGSEMPSLTICSSFLGLCCTSGIFELPSLNVWKRIIFCYNLPLSLTLIITESTMIILWIATPLCHHHHQQLFRKSQILSHLAWVRHLPSARIVPKEVGTYPEMFLLGTLNWGDR